MAPIRVVIVDDHPAVRFGLEAVLNKHEDISVVGVAESGMRALELCRSLQPDVMIVDILMPHMDGIATIRTLHSAHPTVKLLALTQLNRDETVLNAMEAGAIGYLVKDTEIGAIVDAIRAAAMGKRTLSPSALDVLIRSRTLLNHPANQLSDRETEVLSLMVKGLRNPQIAANLAISVSTVKFHISAIFKKLGVSTRTEAVIKAVENGLVNQASD